MNEFGRSLYRERGLKFSTVVGLLPELMSLPLPGAWIEMTEENNEGGGNESLPLPGAWIEIFIRSA